MQLSLNSFWRWVEKHRGEIRHRQVGHSIAVFLESHSFQTAAKMGNKHNTDHGFAVELPTIRLRHVVLCSNYKTVDNCSPLAKLLPCGLIADYRL